MAFTVAQLRDNPRANPVYLVEITLLNGGGTLFFSDRNIVFSAQQYENYLNDLSNLQQELERATSEGRNAEINLLFNNTAYKTDDYLIETDDSTPIQGGAITIKEVYVDVNGNNSSDSVTLFAGVLEEPRNINLLTFEVTASSKDFIEQYRNRRLI